MCVCAVAVVVSGGAGRQLDRMFLCVFIVPGLHVRIDYCVSLRVMPSEQQAEVESGCAAHW